MGSRSFDGILFGCFALFPPNTDVSPPPLREGDYDLPPIPLPFFPPMQGRVEMQDAVRAGKGDCGPGGMAFSSNPHMRD